MAFVNKASLREEFDYLKNQFSELQSQNKLSTEANILFRSMIILFEVMISIFLEKKTKKNSRNSSIPPSQTNKDETSSSSQGSNGKGKSQNDEPYSKVNVTEETNIAEVNYCTHCGEKISDVCPHEHERRTLIDIYFEKKVTHVDAEIKTCPSCHEVTKGWFPSAFKGPLQYGEGVKVFILNLFVAQLVPLKRVQKMIKAIIGRAISEATMLKYVLALHESLDNWEKEGINKLLESKSINCDETSMKVGGKNHWVHVYSSGDITLKFIHPKRGGEAIEDIGIIPRYGGVIIHDCWASYLSYGNCEHALCGSHLLRGTPRCA